jgi:serine/threonine-protein kinase/endoribonuclease IRE1
MEENADFLFIALELCAGDLASLVTRTPPLTLLEKSDIIQQALTGLQSLHRLHITHRDIKPANVLYIIDHDSRITIKLADLGFARQLESSTKGASIVARSQGWQPPEVLDVFEAALEGYTAAKVHPKPADVFSMGLLIFCLFSNKNVHPFGGGLRIETNIQENRRVNIGLGLVPPEVEDLVVAMIPHEPPRRLRTADCLLHPVLWTTERKLDFLKETSDTVVNLVALGSGGPFITDLQASIQCKDWKKLVDARMLVRGKFLDAYGNTADQLLRLVRNKEHHFDELPGDLQAQMGNSKVGVFNYFLDRFPSLLLEVFRVTTKWYCSPSIVDIGDPRYLKQPAKQSNAVINLPSLNGYLGSFSIHFFLQRQA